MKNLFCLLFVLVLFPVFALAEYTEPCAVDQHYTLFFDAVGTATGMGNSFDYDSLCIDLYVMKDRETAYIIICKCFSGLFITSGMEKYTISDQGGALYFVRDNGEYFSAVYDENGVDLWISYDNTQFRMKPISSLSYFEDIH